MNELEQVAEDLTTIRVHLLSNGEVRALMRARQMLLDISKREGGAA